MKQKLFYIALLINFIGNLASAAKFVQGYPNSICLSGLAIEAQAYMSESDLINPILMGELVAIDEFGTSFKAECGVHDIHIFDEVLGSKIDTQNAPCRLALPHPGTYNVSAVFKGSGTDSTGAVPISVSECR